jgi:hypothetical protein
MEPHLHAALLREHLLVAEAAVAGCDTAGIDRHAQVMHVLRTACQQLLALARAPDTAPEAAVDAWRTLYMLETASVHAPKGTDRVTLVLHNTAGAAVWEAAGTVTVHSNCGTLTLYTKTKASTGMEYAVAVLVEDGRLASRAGALPLLKGIAAAVGAYHTHLVTMKRTRIEAAEKHFEADKHGPCNITVRAGRHTLPVDELTEQ